MPTCITSQKIWESQISIWKCSVGSQLFQALFFSRWKHVFFEKVERVIEYFPKVCLYIHGRSGNPLMVQCLKLCSSTAGGTVSLPGWGIPHAARYGQKKFFLKKERKKNIKKLRVGGVLFSDYSSLLHFQVLLVCRKYS